MSQPELRGAIARAYVSVTGRQAPTPLLDTLTAQASLETGRGQQMFNFNFGGIKGASPEGTTARCMTHEVEGGHDVRVRAGFRAYSSLDAGAVDYIQTLQRRFGPALSKAAGGDIDGFSHALKQAGYYTASESDYTSALHALGASSAASAGGAANAVAPAGSGDAAFATSEAISRVMDALASSALRIARPAGEDE